MSAADEQRLILEARNGDRSAFRVLVERHMKHAYNLAFGFVGNHDAAEDIAQEAFVRVFQSLPSFRGDAEFGTWLYRIVTNLSLNYVKATKRRTQVSVEAVAMATPIAEPSSRRLETAELTAYIERALHELPAMQRATVILRHMDGLSTKQVSTILGCSEGTVKTHLFRGLEKMRVKLLHLKEAGL